MASLTHNHLILKYPESKSKLNDQKIAASNTVYCSKLQRGFSAFQKNTGTVHPSDTEHFARRATGSDALTDDQGELWQGVISVGTPPVQFTGRVEVCIIYVF